MSDTQPEGNPTMIGKEINLTTQTPELVAEWARAQQAGRNSTPSTTRVDAGLAWKMVSGGTSTPELLGWPSFQAICDELNSLPGDPIEPSVEWTGPTTNSGDDNA